jgi:GNAT superfamily N-acetyltransferase
MERVAHIVQVGPESFDPAFDLLRRFLAEEGFDVPQEQSRLNLQAFLSRADYGVFLASIAGRPIGIATVSTSVSVELGPMAEIDDLYVLPDARGQGVARALIEAALDWCRRQGRVYVQVTITPEGEAAHGLTGFYDKLGFVETRRTIMALAHSKSLLL